MPKTAKREHFGIKITSLLLMVAILLLLVVIAILLFGYMSGFDIANRISGGSGAGMFSDVMNEGAGGYAGMMGLTGSYAPGTRINISIAESYASNIPSYAHVYSNNNTISFSSSNITLVTLAMDVQSAINLTQKQPPVFDSNSSGNAFVVYGLINPILMVPKNAIVHVEFINLDAGDYHNVMITAAGPPYQYMPMSAMNGMVFIMPIIPTADYPSNSALEYNYTTAFENSGTYWYICMYPGHAQMGMYGKIIVE